MTRKKRGFCREEQIGKCGNNSIGNNVYMIINSKAEIFDWTSPKQKFP